MNAGKHARWYCQDCEQGDWYAPPKDLVACPDCCGFKKSETAQCKEADK